MRDLNFLILYYLLEILSKPEGPDKADKILLTLLQGLVVDVLKGERQNGSLYPEDVKRFQTFLEHRLDVFGRESVRLIEKSQRKGMQREELLFLIAQARERLKEMTQVLLKALEE